MKNNFAFSLGIRYLQAAFTTSKDSKKFPKEKKKINEVKSYDEKENVSSQR